MKKVFNKLRRTPVETEQPARITTDTIAEHREKILAGGRRFKYPVQYARHKLVFNAILISVAALLALLGLGYWQLYGAQNSSDFMYRVTRVVPLPVAVIDGEQVRYSDYLLKYRGSIHYLREIEGVNFSSEDGKRQADFVKNQELNDTIADAYAKKLARELDISVSDVELEEALRQQRVSGQSEQSEAAYYTTIRDYYGWSADEYQDITRTKLLRSKVAYAVDDKATAISAEVAAAIRSGSTDLRPLADTLNARSTGTVVYAAPGLLPRGNQDGGLSKAAATLEKGQISEAIRSSTGDGYYYIKLLDSNTSQVSYEYIRVPLTSFASTITAAQASDDRVNVFIERPAAQTETAQPQQ